MRSLKDAVDAVGALEPALGELLDAVRSKRVAKAFAMLRGRAAHIARASTPARMANRATAARRVLARVRVELEENDSPAWATARGPALVAVRAAQAELQEVLDHAERLAVLHRGLDVLRVAA